VGTDPVALDNFPVFCAMAVVALIIYYVFYSRHQQDGTSKITLTVLTLFVLGTTIFHLLQMP